MCTYQIALYADDNYAEDLDEPDEFIDLGSITRAQALAEAQSLMKRKEIYSMARVVEWDEGGSAKDTDEVWRQGTDILSKVLA